MQLSDMWMDDKRVEYPRVCGKLDEGRRVFRLMRMNHAPLHGEQQQKRAHLGVRALLHQPFLCAVRLVASTTPTQVFFCL
jgi:hypothetical protein